MKDSPFQADDHILKEKIGKINQKYKLKSFKDGNEDYVP